MVGFLKAGFGEGCFSLLPKIDAGAFLLEEDAAPVEAAPYRLGALEELGAMAPNTQAVRATCLQPAADCRL